MKVAVILNGHSSRTEHFAARLPAMFAARAIEPDDIEVVANESSLRKNLRRALKRGAKTIVVGGGDGSMTTAADVLAHTDAVLGVLPLGTGNSFALTLGLDGDIERALDTIAARRIAQIDLGLVNGRHFANFATIGLSAEIANDAPHTLKKIVGPLAYVFGGLNAFLRHEAFRAKIAWDDGSSKIRTQQMVIANGRYFGKTPVLPDASITDRKLSFFTTTGISRVEVARMYVAMGLGVHRHLPDAISFQAKKIIVRTKPRQPLSIDGNAFGKTPARFSVAPRALRVYVPSSFS